MMIRRCFILSSEQVMKKILDRIALEVSAAFEKAGYDVKPMSSGNLKGIKFENGGGYKVNFGGDGIIMYHPEKRSHHGGAYYKISTGKGGIHRYDTKGNEIAKERDS